MRTGDHVGLTLRYAARSDVGHLREGNEDSGYASPHLLVVADGMGGAAAGEVASSVAVAAMATNPAAPIRQNQRSLGVNLLDLRSRVSSIRCSSSESGSTPNSDSRTLTS